MGATPSWLWVRWMRWDVGLNPVLRSYMARFTVLELNRAQTPSSSLATLAASGYNWIFSALTASLAQEWSTSHGVPGSQGHIRRGAHQFSDSKESLSLGDMRLEPVVLLGMAGTAATLSGEQRTKLKGFHGNWV